MYDYCYTIAIMTTINISLPTQLKAQSQLLIDQGYFASFSDLVRSALRTTLEKSRYEVWAQEARDDMSQGRATILRNEADINTFVDEL